MENKKMGPILLSGLMIGPILGSGIIILPPIIYNTAGDWAIFAWMAIIAFSFFFAVIFGKLSILFPGDAGIANAVAAAFGPDIKKLTALYLISAVLFGPVAVMTTAAEYLPLSTSDAVYQIAAILTLGCSFLLLKEITFMGRIAFVLSSLSAITLFSGGMITLFFYSTESLTLSTFKPEAFGYSLLLLFWTIVGWEVIGNYSRDVNNPQTNIPRAVIVSAVVIAAVTLTVASGLQYIHPSYIKTPVRVTLIITPIFGIYAKWVMAALTLSLCVTTYLLFVGGVARLIRALADEGSLPSRLSYRSRNGAPLNAVITLTMIHLMVLLALYKEYARVEDLIAIANGFFIGNAMTGILASLKLMRSLLLKWAAVALLTVFTFILLQSSPVVIIVMLLMAAYYLPKPARFNFKLYLKRLCTALFIR